MNIFIEVFSENLTCSSSFKTAKTYCMGLRSNISFLGVPLRFKCSTKSRLGTLNSVISRVVYPDCHFGLLSLCKKIAGLCCRKQLSSQKPRALQPRLSCSERVDGECIVNFEFSGKSANLNNVCSEAVQLDFRLYLSCRSRPKILRNLALSFLCLMHVIYSITGVECQLSTSVRGWGQRGSPNYRFLKRNGKKLWFHEAGCTCYFSILKKNLSTNICYESLLWNCTVVTA